MDIIKRKNIYFLISGLIIIPGLISILLFGLRFSIDFVGGSTLEVKLPKKVSQQELRTVLQKDNVGVSTIASTGDTSYLIRMQAIDKDQNEKVKKSLSDAFGGVEERQFQTLGPTIGKETATKAVQALLLASLLIVLYIAWSFRSIPKPYSSWKFGLSAIVALVHDILVVIGIFSILGHFYGVEVDSLFVTALLTVIGFSIHDTIVVFDRIRENLRRMSGVPFSKVVNESIIQTINRSLNTSLTVVFVLVAMLLFGGESIHWFIIALLVGIISGTYSSIFNASPFLVLWEEFSQKRRKK